MGEGTRVERLREWIPLKSTEPSTILRSADVTSNRQDLNAHKDDTREKTTRRSLAAVGRSHFTDGTGAGGRRAGGPSRFHLQSTALRTVLGCGFQSCRCPGCLRWRRGIHATYDLLQSQGLVKLRYFYRCSPAGLWLNLSGPNAEGTWWRGAS